jgi:hypothetical protein
MRPELNGADIECLKVDPVAVEAGGEDHPGDEDGRGDSAKGEGTPVGWWGGVVLGRQVDA